YTGRMAWTVLGAFGRLVTGQISFSEMSGPVGTISFMAQASAISWQNIFILLPLLAANLGIFNLLPIPALDGSKIVFASIEWIRKKPINRKVETIIHLVGMALLFGFVIVADIVGIFTACGV
ncbi:MAG: site-2 protease family protein, partial [Firmicutes bacterium]|nr:site-2 protease family protein [Bacillota bacterium]